MIQRILSLLSVLCASPHHMLPTQGDSLLSPHFGEEARVLVSRS